MSVHSLPARESHAPRTEHRPSASSSSILSTGDECGVSSSSDSGQDDRAPSAQEARPEAGQASPASPTQHHSVKPFFSTAARVDSEETLRGPLSPAHSIVGTLSPSSTRKPATTTPAGSVLKKTIATAITSTTAADPSCAPEKSKSRSRVQLVKATVKTLYYDYWIQFSMIGLALLGFLTALAHHLYNQRMDGTRIVGDPEWPPRYGNALSFFVKAMLIASVQIAYKQQAWIAVKKRALKVSTLDALFAVYYDPFQFASFEFLVKTWLPAMLAVVSWALPLCAIASPSTLTSTGGYHTIATTCPNIPVMNFTREFNHTLTGATDSLAGLASWNQGGPNKDLYTYANPSSELQRIFTLSSLSSTGPIQPANNPCPAGTNCTYAISFHAAAYGCEERDEFGGPGQQLRKSDLAPVGDAVYGSYFSQPMGPEDEYGAPLLWYNMTDADPDDPMIGVFTGLPSLWLGWCTATPTPEDSWASLVPHVAECQMYNATYTFEITFASGQMSINRSQTTLHHLLLPPGTTKSPSEPDYLEFGSYHATGLLLRTLLRGNSSLANKGDLLNEYVITYTPATQTTLLHPATQLPAGGADLATSVAHFYRDIFVSMMSDRALHDLQNTTAPCTTTAAVQVWHYAPLWLVLPYSIAAACTLLTLGVGLHGFVVNGYAADANFSTFVMTSRSRDLDALSRGASLGHWPKEKRLMESRLRFGEIETEEGGEPHAAFAFPENVGDFDRRKPFVHKGERGMR